MDEETLKQLFAKAEHTTEIEKKLELAQKVLSELFELPSDLVKVRFHINGFAPRASDGRIVWSLSESYTVELKK